MINDLLVKRAAAFDSFKALADKPTLTPEENNQYNEAKRSVEELDGQITRQREVQAAAARTAQPVAGQDNPAAPSVPATVETDRYVREKSLVIGGTMKLLGRSGGIISVARADAIEMYGESHPVTRALNTGQGGAGGFIVPPDYMNEIIELLRPRAVVRAAGPRNMPMPRGTMTMPGQGSAASASYGSEGSRIGTSQQGLNSIVATYKKLMAMVPISNDMMRYANPAVDAFVRDDLVKVIALTEDQAFILGEGTKDTPRGYLSFAQSYAAANSGSAGVFVAGAGASTAASGGNFITSTASYTLATVAAELGGAVNRLDSANVVESRRVWFMHPRSYNYLYNVQNSLGVYVYRDELTKGTLLGYPVKKTTQIGTNYGDAGSNRDCSFVFLVEMDEDLLLDSMQLELAVSREGSYVDAASGQAVSAFQNDQTVMRAIAEHDHQMRHDAAVAVIQFVRWAPAIS